MIERTKDGNDRMQVTETLNEGLKRKLEVTIPADDLAGRRDTRLNELKGQVNLKGFRPGKVPMAHLKNVYGRSVMSEVMQDAINTTVQGALTDREERAAAQPKVDMTEDQGEINRILDGTADLKVEVSYEVLPEIKLMDFKKVEVERPVVPVTDEEVDTEVSRLFAERREYEEKDEKAKIADGDRVGLKFVGKIDGEPFEGGSSDHAHLVVGAGQYIPGFEEQLVGLKKGGTKELKVKFPDDYVNEELAGKDATFDVEILHIDTPKEGEMDDEFAKSLGLDDLAALKEAVRGQIQDSHASMARQRVKRQILDALDEGHTFELPAELVDAEFNQIWERVTHEIEHHGRSFEDEGTTEEEARAQYKTIAERRVRLGLVVAEVGNKNEIQVTEEEHQQALIREVQRFPGQEQQVYDFYRSNPQALAGLRAPVFEDKVVDFIAELAKTTEVETTRTELAKQIELLDDDQMGGAHVHDHDHDHDHHDHDHDGHDHDHDH